MTLTSVRVAGALSWLAANVVFFAAHIFTQLAWSRPYSWADNNISDLGNVTCGPWGDDHRYVCSPRHAVLDTALIITGVLLAMGILLSWRRWRTATAPVVLLIGCAGWVLAGAVPADVNENLHVLGALLIFGFGNLGLLLAARSHWPEPIRALAAVCGAAGLVAMVLTFAHRYLGLGMGGMERVTAFAIPLWAAVAALTNLKAEQ